MKVIKARSEYRVPLLLTCLLTYPLLFLTLGPGARLPELPTFGLTCLFWLGFWLLICKRFSSRSHPSVLSLLGGGVLFLMAWATPLVVLQHVAPDLLEPLTTAWVGLGYVAMFLLQFFPAVASIEGNGVLADMAKACRLTWGNALELLAGQFLAFVIVNALATLLGLLIVGGLFGLTMATGWDSAPGILALELLLLGLLLLELQSVMLAFYFEAYRELRLRLEFPSSY